ncbi:stage V sporulation protein D [Paenibacillus harenae]|uniref:Stage V sporulation protein D (Sporulation-specific penicillin-binding protein) n=1 Tax=Paenibacillus harenae TaxID=306543 RepID=A0ABT9TZS2_PAEHA|nr:stage V sporulation protein D [Paenibacillus harenae]MDQ0112864.1 stage V sporulation protein D (sporulation-specific penicillin-binding protein) [Paenibacillus harenae]
MKVSNVTVRRRLFIVLLCAGVMFVALCVRLGYVQLWMGEQLAGKAEDSWRRNVPYAPKRGEIWDRNGVQLAYNISSPTVFAIPAQIKDRQAAAAALAPLLDMSEETLYNKMKPGTMIVSLKPGGRKMTLEKAQQIRDLSIPGIVVAEDNKRYYPFGSLAAHVLGFTGIDNQGLTGIESKFNKELSGIAGNVSFLADAAGRQMPNSSDTYIPPKDGLTLQLTIDKQIQAVMERELDQAMTGLQADSVIAIAMDPNNGEILGMASRPTYEPANYKQVSAEVYNRNLPIWMTYEPGSTFKIITLAAALEEKKVNLTTERFFDPGAIEVGGARLRCWKKGGHGSQTFLEVVENSCNPGFVTLGNRLGKEKLFEYIRNFGFGQKTGIDIGGEENGILFKLNQVGPVELATTAFGQGVSVTPIQQITAVSAAINGGTLYKPHVAKSWINPSTGETVQTIEPEPVRQVISEDTSRQVREALESVVAKGTGRNAFIDGYRVGGKTGTAQKVINGRYSPNEHIVSFVGFAPADDPQIVIYVAVDNPQGIQFGGIVAAPIVRNMMEDALTILEVPRREQQIGKTYKLGETPIVAVPNLVGKTVSDIYEDMNMNFNLTSAGSGKTVIRQAPAAGTRVERGSTIRIYLADEDDINHTH